MSLCIVFCNTFCKKKMGITLNIQTSTYKKTEYPVNPTDSESVGFTGYSVFFSCIFSEDLGYSVFYAVYCEYSVFCRVFSLRTLDIRYFCKAIFLAVQDRRKLITGMESMDKIT